MVSSLNQKNKQYWNSIVLLFFYQNFLITWSYFHVFLVKICLFWQGKQVFQTCWVSLLINSQFSSPSWNFFLQWLHSFFVWFVLCQFFFSKVCLFWHKSQKFIVVTPSFWRFQYSWPLINDSWQLQHLSNGGVHWFSMFKF